MSASGFSFSWCIVLYWFDLLIDLVHLIWVYFVHAISIINSA